MREQRGGFSWVYRGPDFSTCLLLPKHNQASQVDAHGPSLIFHPRKGSFSFLFFPSSIWLKNNVSLIMKQSSLALHVSKKNTGTIWLSIPIFSRLKPICLSEACFNRQNKRKTKPSHLAVDVCFVLQ